MEWHPGKTPHLVDPAAVVAQQLTLLTQVLGVDLTLIRDVQTIRLLQGALQSDTQPISARCPLAMQINMQMRLHNIMERSTSSIDVRK